ncbi:MAG TPA: hypothetical protein VIH61_10520, partial [Waddliaceae bacterium]
QEEPSCVDNSFQCKDTFEELFTAEDTFFETIPVYPDLLPGNAQMQENSMTKPMMKGSFIGDEFRFIALKMKCISDPKVISEKIPSLDKSAGKLPELERREIREEMVADIKEKTTVLLFLRHKHGWRQWRIRYNGVLPEIAPSFLLPHEGGQLGPKPNYTYNDKDFIQLQVEGFSSLKKLMKGEAVTDLKGLEWKLDTSE